MSNRTTRDSAEGQQLIIDAAQIKNNYFISDVIGKLVAFGSISPAQHSAVRNAITRGNWPQEVVGEAPVGKVTVIGTVLCTKVKENRFGSTLKMLVKLENNSKVWCTVPSGIRGEPKGCKISLTATFERSPQDAGFSFGSRPKAEVIERAPEVQAAIDSRNQEKLEEIEARDAVAA